MTWVYDKDLQRVVTREEFDARRKNTKRSSLAAPQVMSDIKPFRNVAIDGAVIGSRSHKREMMKQHGLVEVGNDFRVTKRKSIPKTSVRQSLKRTLNQLGA